MLPGRMLCARLLLLISLLFANSLQSAYVLTVGRNNTTATAGIDSFYTPPDAGLGVSTNHIVEFINGRFSVFDKSLNKLQSFTDSNFWFRAGITVPAGWGFSDPRIVFDSASQRWFVSQTDVDAGNDANRFVLAVSATSDPTGAWRGVAFLVDPVNGYWADFPTLGVDSNAIYLAGDLFDLTGSPVYASALFSIPKSDLLLNPPTAAGRTSLGPLDYSSYGQILQPVVATAGATGTELVLAIGDLGFDFLPHSTMFGFSIQNASSEGGASLGAPTTISIPNYSIPINPLQLGGITNNINDGDSRISATVYRVGNVLYATHGTQMNDKAAIQWFKIDSTTFNVLDTGILTHPSLDLFYPSIAANGNGTVVLAFNGSSVSNSVSSYAILAEPVNGTLSFGNPVLLKAGVAAYRTNEMDSRWGDYSGLCVDPANPTHFWALTMFPSSKTAWSTQLTELIATPLLLSLTKSATNIVLSWPGAAAGYQLQSTLKLPPTNWSQVTTPAPQLTNNLYMVSLPATNRTRFFRLTK